LSPTPRPARLTALGDELFRIHDSLRAELRRLQDGVRDPGRPLAVHCLAFCAALTRHHTGEDAGAARPATCSGLRRTARCSR
jgi:hypothetical protein